jgi:PhoH-like ATPase
VSSKKKRKYQEQVETQAQNNDGFKDNEKEDNNNVVKTISPRNDEQVKLFNLLQDENIEVLFVEGKAGTGKSLCTLAVGIQALLEGRYKKLALFKPLVGIGKSMGALPGDSKEKVRLLYNSFFDNTDIFFPKSWLDRWLNRNKLELNTLEYIRGRSIHDAFIIVEEIQNLTDFELYTVLTRKSENAKMVLLYDPKQSDTHNRGVLNMIERLKSSNIKGLGFCQLIKSERCKFVEDISILFDDYNFTR